jgi:hypothetical protein
VVFNIDGESYRMRAHRARAERPVHFVIKRCALLPIPTHDPCPASASPSEDATCRAA